MSDTIDFLVVGAGVAGLTAGALLARAGHRVAVFDKHSKLGGYAQYFGHEPTFDASTHLIGGMGPRGWARAAFEEAGVLDRVEWLPLDPLYQSVFPAHRYTTAADPERFRQELAAIWPTEAEGIRRFFDTMASLGREFLTLADGPPAPGSLLAKYAGLTLSELLNECTRSEELRAALSALWIFAGLPPQRLSALHYVMLWQTFQVQGSAAVKGGVKLLTQALADVITENGGIVETRMRVERIHRSGGRVTGARVEDGREFRTRAVISTASPQDTFEELLADEYQSPAGYPPLRIGWVTSVSAMQIHLLVDGPIDLPARVNILHGTYDLQDAYFHLQWEEPRYSALVGTVLDYHDPGRVPEGKHAISLYTLAPYSRFDNWNVPFEQRRTKEYRTLPDYLALKERLGSQLIEQAEALFPGLSGRIELKKVASPMTMERYTFNTGGAAFGWANVPEQSGPNRPGPRTPFEGLYMAGHWTFPGGSIAGAVTSGRIAAKTILHGG